MLLERVVMVHLWVLNWFSRILGQKKMIDPHDMVYTFMVHSAFSLSCKKSVYEGPHTTRSVRHQSLTFNKSIILSYAR